MNLDFKNLPTINLPYNNINLCKQMMLRLYENVPYLPELPLIDKKDTLFNRTFSNIECITVKDGKILLPEQTNEVLNHTIMRFDKVCNSTQLSDFEEFGYNSPYFELYLEMLKRIKPNYTVINLMGAFTFANSVFNRNAALLLTDKTYRKFIIQTITVKALWFIYKIKEASADTTPLIIFDENLLYKFGTLKRSDENITKETVTTMFTKIFQKIQNAGGKVGVQSFNKCNWQLVFDSHGANMISFDAYNNPNNLNIIAKSVRKFLAKGGYINWGIVPVMNENVIRSLNISILQSRFTSTLETLAEEGIPIELLYNNSTVSTQGDLSQYSILFAEKALMLAEQLGKKIPKNFKTD